MSEDVWKENVEFEWYQAWLKKATAKQDKIFDQYYNKYFLPAKQREVEIHE